MDGGFGIYTGNKPFKVASAVSRFFSDDELLLRMSRLAREQSHQDATTAIASDIGDMIFNIKRSTKSKSSPLVVPVFDKLSVHPPPAPPAPAYLHSIQGKESLSSHDKYPCVILFLFFCRWIFS